MLLDHSIINVFISAGQHHTPAAFLQYSGRCEQGLKDDSSSNCHICSFVAGPQVTDIPCLWVSL